VSLSDPLPGADPDEGLTIGDTVVDETAGERLKERLGALLVEQLFRRLPGRLHAQIVEARWDGREWEEIAGRTGVSLRTARNYYNRSIEILIEVARSEDWGEQR